MSESAALSAGAELLNTQYNNLRKDVLDTSAGHDHTGAADHGKYSGNIPVGGIFMWAGTAASLPAGFQFCDGTNGTPDLRGQFVIGAGSTYAVGATGGAATKDLSHVHAGSFTVGPGTSHTHGGGTLSASNAGRHNHNNSSVESTGTGHYPGLAAGLEYDYEADHTHSVATGASGAEAAHVHTISGNVASGGSATQSIMPAYYVLAFVMRVS